MLPMTMFPGVGTGKFKPFDVLAEQFSKVAASYKKAESKEQRRQLLAVMRLILDEADSLHQFYSDKEAADLNSRLPSTDLRDKEQDKL